ncbi:MAG TPA: DUF4838 domain-containing protein [Abditibacteriaceae bacterium]
MKIFPICCLVFLLGATMSAQSQEKVLAYKGKSAYVIALAADAIPAEQTAARELQEHLKQMSGATLPIKSETEVPEKAPQILVGGGPRVQWLVEQPNTKSLGDGFFINTSGNQIILAGGRPRGTLYAVYEFLEALGCRFWAPGESFIPKQTTLRVPNINSTYFSPFHYREQFTSSVQQDPLFATKMRENGHFQTQKPEWGGHYSIIGFVHTFDALLPPSKHFKAHPDWYGPGAAQPCLTNLAARQEIIKNALAQVRANPTAGLISISQNDNVSPCQCANCKALEDQEDSPGGPLLQTVNAVAEAVEKEFPGFLVETLAYQYTRKPPKTIRPRANVIIRLCSIEADFSKPLDSEANASFRDDIKGWKSIAPRLYIWDYMTNFTNSLWPHPNFRVLGPNLRFFAQNNVVGVFEQGDAYSNGTGDFPQLRAYLIGKLMWNPQQDENKIIDEFLQGYYGKAAPHLKAYLNLMQDAFAQSGQKLSTFHGDHSWLTLQVMNQATRHFQAAQNAVQNDAVFAKRVRRARLPLDHVWIVRFPVLKRQAETQRAAFEGPQDLNAFGEEFLKANEEFGTGQWKEGGPWKDYAPSLKRRLVQSKATPLPADLKLKPGASVLDIQDNLFTLFRAGELATLVDDAGAGDGKAARIVGNTTEWAVQWHPDDDNAFLKAAPWHCYLRIRVEHKAGTPIGGTAFTCGIYDTATRTYLAQEQRTLEETASGEYQWIDLGTQPLKTGTYVWAAPTNNPNIQAIYIDRIICVRE